MVPTKSVSLFEIDSITDSEVLSPDCIIKYSGNRVWFHTKM